MTNRNHITKLHADTRSLTVLAIPKSTKQC